jgi:hypothetical protein
VHFLLFSRYAPGGQSNFAAFGRAVSLRINWLATALAASFLQDEQP